MTQYWMSYASDSNGVDRLNISQIEYLSAAVRFGSFAEAARQLHITPQAISKAVKALEQETGLELFHFDGKGVRASQKALDIAGHAEAFLDSYVDLRTYMLCEARGGGASPHCASVWRGRRIVANY